MKKNPEKIKPGWWVPVKVKESFVDFCSDVGHHVQEDFAGALFIWPYLPAQIRELANLEAKGIETAGNDFWQGLKTGLSGALTTPIEIPQQKKAKKSG